MSPERRRLPRAERREQILTAATRAFARTGFAATGLDHVAAEAGVTHVILYRHFASKTDLYRAVLDRACDHLATTVGPGDTQYDATAVPALLRAAATDPDGFRLLFRHATREPDFRDYVDRLTTTSTDVAARHLATAIPPGPWLDWATRLVPVVAIEAVLTWLDAGQPNPTTAATRIHHTIRAVIEAAQLSTME